MEANSDKMAKDPSRRVDVGQIEGLIAPLRLSPIQRQQHESGRDDDDGNGPAAAQFDAAHGEIAAI
jgi:hypothetical protein